jgi:hypothetical protein
VLLNCISQLFEPVSRLMNVRGGEQSDFHYDAVSSVILQHLRDR